MDGTGETAAQRVTDLEAQLAAAREAAADEAAAGAAPAEQQAAATDAAAQAGANDAQAAQAGAQAVAEVAPGDGTRPQDGQATATAEGTGAIQAAPSPPSSPPNPTGVVPAVPAAEGTAGDKPASVIDLVKQAHDEAVQAGEGVQPGQHHFVEVLRNVAGRLVEDGRIVEADLLTPAESGRIHATLIKLVGELVGKL